MSLLLDIGPPIVKAHIETIGERRARVVAAQGGSCFACHARHKLDVIDVEGEARAYCRSHRVRLQAAERRAAGRKPKTRQREVKGTRRRRREAREEARRVMVEGIVEEVIRDVGAEIRRVDVLRGDDIDTPIGTSAERWTREARQAREEYDAAEAIGGATMALALREEVFEALSEENPEACYRELIQVASVAVRTARTIRARQRSPKKI